jgi:hypothetical protein
MGKVCPVGTIHTWSVGDMIKAFDPLPPFSSGWIPVKTNARFDQIGREADATAKEIIGHKVPINGEKCIDYEIDLFGEQDGSSFYKADNFKQYMGWYGAEKYAFRNEFSKMFMNNDMRLAEAVAEALDEANKDAGGDRILDKLTDESKKEIRKRVRAEFKEDPDKITEEKALQLLDIVKRTRDQVKEGLDFKDPEKKRIYDEFKKMADSLPADYMLMSEKRMVKFDATDMIEGAFQDNWGVRESCKDYAQDKFNEYVKKYADRISEDSLNEQMKMYGVNIDMSADEFYSKIYAKAKNQDYDFLEKYVGKDITITDWSGSHRVKLFWKKIMAVEDDEVTHDELSYKRADGLELNLIERLRSGDVKLSKDYDEFGGGFKDLIYLRFMKHYNKSIEGDWTLEHLPAIQNMENIINELPDGHFKTNDSLKLVTNKDYNGGSHGGYAWYMASERRINLSAKCVERATSWGVLGKPTEFKSVMLHEIGHAVDNKLQGKETYDYKKFVVSAGWSYQQEELRHGKSATGDQKDIPRSGSNASVTLITEYSKKSPSEAFAEYYSFYNLNKEHLDKYFKSNDRNALKAQSRIVAKSVSSEQPISKMLPHRVDATAVEHWEIYKNTEQELSERGGDHTITLNSPWDVSLSHEEKVKLSKSTIKFRKDYSIHSMPPAVAVKDGLSRLVIDGGVRMEVAKMNKQLLPCIEISKEEYYVLREKGMTDVDIADCVYTKHADDYVPKQIAPAVRVTGLVYRDELIPMDIILDNHDVLKTMSDICGSPELQKALGDLFSV